MADAIRTSKITARVAIDAMSASRTSKLTARVAVRQNYALRVTKMTARVAVLTTTHVPHLGALTPGQASVF